MVFAFESDLLGKDTNPETDAKGWCVKEYTWRNVARSSAYNTSLPVVPTVCKSEVR